MAFENGGRDAPVAIWMTTVAPDSPFVRRRVCWAIEGPGRRHDWRARRIVVSCLKLMEVALNDLFSQNSAESPGDRSISVHAPLAEQLRPQTPDQVIGQQHLLGAGKPLRLAFESGLPHSMILWGPPGVGKTTLARMMATQFKCEFIALSAVFSGIKEVREAVAQAEMWRAQGKRTILFVDEIHRFNKALKVSQVYELMH